jgi:hypothetical protein
MPSKKLVAETSTQLAHSSTLARQIHHIDGTMKIMVQLLRGGRFADEIMQMPASEKAAFVQAEVKDSQYAKL